MADDCLGEAVGLWEFLRQLPESVAADYIARALTAAGVPVSRETVYDWLTRRICR